MPAVSSNRAVSAFELSKSLSELGISTGKPINEDEEHYRDSLIEEILLEFNRDPETYEYVDVPEEKQALVKALHSGIDKHMQTIADAFAEYLETKAKKDPVERHAQLTRYKYVEKILADAIGLDVPISALSRQHARTVTNNLLSLDLKVSTVRRYLKDMRAVINFVIREHDIGTQNPFSHIDLPDDGRSNRNNRISMPSDVVEAMLKDLANKDNHQPYFVFAILYMTGARLAEITGLKCKDVILNDDVPHICIRPNDIRRLKNDWSARNIPVCTATQALLHDALRLSGDDEALFSRYIKGRGADRASAWLMKVIRRHTADKKITVHSLRHNFRDRIRMTGVAMERGNALEGHRYSRGEEANYGHNSAEWLKVLYGEIIIINENISPAVTQSQSL